MTKLSFSVTLYWKKHAEDERYGDNFGYYVVRVHHSKAHKGTFTDCNLRKFKKYLFFSVKSKNDLSEEDWKNKQFTTKATYKYENLVIESTENVSRYHV